MGMVARIPSRERQHEIREETEQGKGRPEDFSLHSTILELPAGTAEVSKYSLMGETTA